jgi:hypothetical protein
MRLCAAILLLLAGFGTWGLLRAQKPFQEFDGIEYQRFPLPPDWQRQAEFVRARLRYPSVGGVHGFEDSGFRTWTIDYPRTDRHFLQGVRRLTRIDARSVEQVVDLDNSDDIYNWPFLYAVEVGHWELNEEQAEQLRDYLLRGGFMMTDDFHGTLEWEQFMESMHKVFPDRPPVDIAAKDEIFHVLYDLDERIQVPGAQSLFYPFKPYEYDGFEAKYRAIYDEKGRIMAGICHNMDLGDAIEWSDDPRYPEKQASLAYRIAMNYVIYDLTH